MNLIWKYEVQNWKKWERIKQEEGHLNFWSSILQWTYKITSKWKIPTLFFFGSSNSTINDNDRSWPLPRYTLFIWKERKRLIGKLLQSFLVVRMGSTTWFSHFWSTRGMVHVLNGLEAMGHLEKTQKKWSSYPRTRTLHNSQQPWRKLPWSPLALLIVPTYVRPLSIHISFMY